jgi:hypothetical protein
MAKTTFRSGGKGGAMRGQDAHTRSGVGRNNTPKPSTFRPLPGRNR